MPFISTGFPLQSMIDPLLVVKRGTPAAGEDGALAASKPCKKVQAATRPRTMANLVLPFLGEKPSCIAVSSALPKLLSQQKKTLLVNHTHRDVNFLNIAIRRQSVLFKKTSAFVV